MNPDGCRFGFRLSHSHQHVLFRQSHSAFCQKASYLVNSLRLTWRADDIQKCRLCPDEAFTSMIPSSNSSGVPGLPQYRHGAGAQYQHACLSSGRVGPAAAVKRCFRGCMRRFQLAAKRAGATSGTLDQGRLCEPGVQFHRQCLAAECACLACCQTTGLHQGRLLRRRLHGDPAGSDVVVVVLTDASVSAEVVEFATAMRSLQLEGPNSRMSPFFSSTGSPCIGMASWPSARPSDVA